MRVVALAIVVSIAAGACGRIGYETVARDVGVGSPDDAIADRSDGRVPDGTLEDAPPASDGGDVTGDAGDGDLGTGGDAAIMTDADSAESAVDGGPDASDADGALDATVDGLADSEVDATLLEPCGCSLGCTSGGACREVLDVSVGWQHACALGSDQRVFCWGDNSLGQLGNGTHTGSPFATEVVGLTDAVAIAAGAYNTCAVKADGSAVCWGYNGKGQLGLPASVLELTMPGAPVEGVANARDIVFGEEHGCVIDSSMRGFCWGQTPTAYVAVARDAPAPIRSMSAAEGASVLVTTTGELHEWNAFLDAVGPLSLVASDVLDATVSQRSGFYIGTDGVVRARGFEDWGQLGDGPPNANDLVFHPIAVSGVIDLGVSVQTSCALVGVAGVGGTLRCWGGSMVGDGTLRGRDDTSLPREITTPARMGLLLDVEGGNYGGRHLCARSRTHVACFGTNAHGELGRGSTSAVGTPTHVAEWDGANDVALGTEFACGTVPALTCAGSSISVADELPASTVSATPIATTLGAFDSVALGRDGRGGCGLRGGTVTCWGSNESGQLGVTGTVATPRVLPEVTDATRIFRGSTSACALTARETLECWGTLSFPSAAVPPTDMGLVGVVDFVFDSHLCAVLRSGLVRCRGSNTYGELGTGTAGARTTVWSTVAGVSDAVAVGAGGGGTCVVHATGTVSCFGLVVGFAEDRMAPQLTPLAIPGITGAQEIMMDGRTVCVGHIDGGLSCWGDFPGAGRYEPRPVRIAEGATLFDVHRGACYGQGGRTYCWGDAELGRLGVGVGALGVTVESIAPVRP